jgi:hypothetical protein
VGRKGLAFLELEKQLFAGRHDAQKKAAGRKGGKATAARH